MTRDFSYTGGKLTVKDESVKLAILTGNPSIQQPWADEQEALDYANTHTIYLTEPVPPEQRLQTLVEQNHHAIEDDFKAAVAQVRAGYSGDEIASWDKQEREARALEVDANALTPLLDSTAASNGLPKAALAASIIAKADAYAQAYGGALGAKQARQKALAIIDLQGTEAEAQIAAI